MAAIRSGASQGCLARCFLRQTGKSRPGSHSLPGTWKQKFHFHTVVECRRTAAQIIMGRQQSGKFTLTNCAAVRYNSSQIPVEAISVAIPAVEASASPPVPESTPVLVTSDPSTAIAQPASELMSEAPLTAGEVLQGALHEP